MWRTAGASLAAMVLGTLPALGALSAKDADGRMVEINPKGKTTLVLIGNDEHGGALRDAARMVDNVRGRSDFRLYVVVDLQDTFGADLAPDLVTDRMKENMDNEVPQLRKLYAMHGNNANPRTDMATFADFDGKLVQALGWKDETDDYMRAILFNKDGKVVMRWNELRKENYPAMSSKVNQTLGGGAVATPKAVPAKAVRVAQPVQ